MRDLNFISIIEEDGSWSGPYETTNISGPEENLSNITTEIILMEMAFEMFEIATKSQGHWIDSEPEGAG